MFNAGQLIKASLEMGRRLLGPAWHARHPARALVPIRSLGPSHVERIRAHLLSLGPRDRYLRFGYAANDEQIGRYVDGLNFERDEIFGIYNRRLELLEEQIAQADYHLKVQARQFLDVLKVVQDVRQGVREARERSAP